MKIAFLLQDEQLIQRFKLEKPNQCEEFEFFSNREMLQAALSNTQFDGIVLSDRLFDFISLCDFVEIMKRQNHRKITLLLSNQHDSKSNEKNIKFCLANEIEYIPPGQPISLIVKKVFKQLFVEARERSERSNVVLFMGSTPNIGTTVVAYSTAMQMAMQTEQEIAYVCLNLKSSKIHRYMGIDQPATTLDGIRAEIKSHSLSKDRLKQYCLSSEEVPNFHVMFGNMFREQAEFYSIEDIHHLLDILSTAFDLCVVDVNAYWDNAATISGLLYANTKIIVTTNQLGDFQEDMDRWLKNGSAIFDMNLNSFDLFITKLQKSTMSDGYRIKDVRKETGMNIVGKLSKLDQVDELLNQGRISDLAAYEPQILEQLSGLINMLITVYSLNKKRKIIVRKRMFILQKWIGG